MGHVCSILVFSEKLQKKTIESRCFAWQRDSCDKQECSRRKGPCMPVKFTGYFFDNYDEAEQFLFKTFGNYDQTAVRYRDGKKTMWAVACEVHH